ncbi:MAG: ATP-binding cassette domain-containing protein [Thermoguttaceae bacterium]|jgi:ABC-2 type transport system ATP-binding protein|nr:ATP-binding cassette domain-containing protein [Thermoguttaceae bacterium]
MIYAHNLTKIYGRFIATENVSFRISRGEIACFLGPNGAGKSTTMKMLTGFLAPTSGCASISGFDMSSERIAGARKLGYLPENSPLYPDMTPESLLRFFAELRQIPKKERKKRIDSVVDLCELQSVFRRPIGRLSRGYRQRVGMAQALLHDPDVVILDEPTAGLDPNQIQHVRNAIRRIGQTKTVLLSTHILQEVRAVASRVVFVSDGRVVFDGTVDQFGKDADDFDIKFRELTRTKRNRYLS